jgi:hypothetical protein
MTVKTSDPAVQTALTAAPAQTASPLGATSAQTASLIDWSAQSPISGTDRKIAPLTASDPLDWYIEPESVEA